MSNNVFYQSQITDLTDAASDHSRVVAEVSINGEGEGGRAGEREGGLY